MAIPPSLVQRRSRSPRLKHREVRATTRWHRMVCLSLDLGPTVQVASFGLPL